jgi:hypothetical protein
VGVAAPKVPDAVRIAVGEDQPAYGKGLFLVRPDGYVGWAGDTEAGLAGYLARVGL